MDKQQTYLIFDGDKIGDVLARSYLSNSEDELAAIDRGLRAGLLAAEHLLRSRSMFMIACGADGITCKGFVGDVGSLFLEINQLTQPFSFSLGCGKTLREAFLCLRFAKACGRERWAIMGEDGKIAVTGKEASDAKKND